LKAHSIFSKQERILKKVFPIRVHRRLTAVQCVAIFTALTWLSCRSHVTSANFTIADVVTSFIAPDSGYCSKIAGFGPGQWDSLVGKAVAASVFSPGEYSTVLKDSFSNDFTLGYLTPPAIRQDTAYPLIIYLHGGTGSPLSTKGEKAFDMLRPLADTFALFLASPSANRSSPWWSPAGISRVLQTLRFMAMHYPVNPRKVFLAGVSDGATGCWAMANTAPSPFAGFIAVSGFGGMLPGIAMPLVPTNIMQRPVYNVNAGKDRIYNIAEVNKFLDWMVEKGARIERKEYPEELHGFDYRSREFGPLAGIIRSWSRPENEQGCNWTTVPGFPNSADNIISFTLDHASQSGRISSFWKNDTLDISVEGLREAVVSFPKIDRERIAVRINKNNTRLVGAMRADGCSAYRWMLHACFPAVARSACYRIQF
jgi:pimeloyl-ACP methyl ester carboxylesterase